jgi:beta-phosphoglucomutase-like phosphatase (HAD superfamily)
LDILILDMDGVLLEANGYHRALQKTVQFSADHLGLEKICLSQDQIYTFESLGISSEWHSSALCMAFLEIQLAAGLPSLSLDLSQLFTAIQRQSLTLPARLRGAQALQDVCTSLGLDYLQFSSRILESENIERSLTMNWFQELVLGSKAYQERYQKEPMLDTASYLETYDLPLIEPFGADLISNWSVQGGIGAAIMTNRPSSGPHGFRGSPEAELGRNLVGLAAIPLIGYGEIAWLADRSQNDPDQLAKPNPCHALAAIFLALGLPKEISLTASLGDFSNLDQVLLGKMQGKTITVMEDTPAGIRSVRNAGELLRQIGIGVEVDAIGIAVSKIKKDALEAEGARVVSEINSVLSSLNDLGSFS